MGRALPLPAESTLPPPLVMRSGGLLLSHAVLCTQKMPTELRNALVALSAPPARSDCHGCVELVRRGLPGLCGSTDCANPGSRSRREGDGEPELDGREGRHCGSSTGTSSVRSGSALRTASSAVRDITVAGADPRCRGPQSHRGCSRPGTSAPARPPGGQPAQARRAPTRPQATGRAALDARP